MILLKSPNQNVLPILTKSYFFAHLLQNNEKKCSFEFFSLAWNNLTMAKQNRNIDITFEIKFYKIISGLKTF